MMNQDNDGFNQNNSNIQGNNEMPNNQPLNNQNSNQSFNTVTNENQSQINSNMYQQPVKPKKNKLIKVLAIIGGIVVGIILLSIIIILIVSAGSDKLVCKSSEGDITIMYKDNGITGYIANGIGYDLDGQKEYAKKIGMDAYITEFNNWFTSNTTGTCTIDGKEVEK